jgi:DNA/RNA-binding domain of Phe-tRNA-synthetase-like protein
MKRLELRVSREVFEKFPGAFLGIVFGECEENSLSDENIFEELKESAFGTVRNLGKPLGECENVIAWRKAYKKFGMDPSKKKPSAEALARRVSQGEALPWINAIVDCYNLVSVKHLLPMGGQDLGKITGRVELRTSVGREKFTALGGREELTDFGEVVYADAQKILCRSWNHRDCEEGKITDNTREFFLVVDGVDGISEEKVREAANDLASSLEKCVKGCKTGMGFCGREKSEVALA